jgi:hypothetical protein
MARDGGVEPSGVGSASTPGIRGAWQSSIEHQGFRSEVVFTWYFLFPQRECFQYFSYSMTSYILVYPRLSPHIAATKTRPPGGFRRDISRGGSERIPEGTE